jgi:hypothetical protein
MTDSGQRLVRAFSHIWRAALISTALAATSLVAPRSVQAQSTTEIVRGRVLSPENQPLPDVEVLVTGLATRNSQRTRTDGRGNFTVLFANAEADYLIAVRKIGFVSTMARASRTGVSNVLSIDIAMQSAARMLDTVQVTAGDTTGRRSIGEESSGNLAEALFLTDPRNLMQLLLSIPGIVGDTALSALGVSSTMTLDGATFSGRELPPDALSSARGITSSADPAKGGFSGGNVAATLKGGTDIFAATVRGNMTDPSAMAWNDPSWTRPLQRTLDMSGTVNGPIVKGKARYNVSWRGGERSTPWFSLLAPQGAVLSQQGIQLDSVAAVTSAMIANGIPTYNPGIPRSLVNRSISMSGVVDWAPGPTTSLRLSYNTNWQDGVGDATSMTAFPTRANQTGFTANNLNLKVSGYVRGLLNEVTTSFNEYHDHSNPYLELPTASVRVGTAFDDGRTGFTNLQFGGGQGEYFERTERSEIIDELSWLPKDGSHKVKIGGRISFDRSTYFFFPESPLLGRYVYQSVADLAANRPASYERTLATAPRRTQAQNNSLWIGDEWMKSKALQIQTGLRFDFANPLTRPLYNPKADSVFGIHTDRIPDFVGISPRLGFSWSSAQRLGKGTAGGSSSLGGMSAQMIAGMPFEVIQSLLEMERSGGSTLPGIGINGSLGAYRGGTSTGQIAEYVESSGMGTRVLLSCVGDAVPTPNWRTMTEGPSTCASGGGGTTYGISSPLVRTFDPEYRPTTSWRASLSVDGIRVPGKWILRLNGSANMNLNNQSNLDLNLNRTPKFLLASEGNRPVYVAASAIFPSTGSSSQAASRISPEFTTVQKTVSDLRSYNTQLQATVVPPRPLFREKVNVQFSYTLAKNANEQRGNTRVGITGDPWVKEWVRNTNPLHAFRANVNGRIWWLNAGISAQLMSGIPFAPRVAGDVNGDGDTGNDRAFIPDPATTADTSLARQMNDLLATAPSAARKCLTSQLGRMAGANTCSMPWQFRLDLNASLSPPSSWPYSDRLRVTFNTMNASGGLVRLLGLQNTPLGQSTLSTSPITTLLYVTGFDPAKQSYKYRVNQTFGQATNYGSLRQRFAPLQMQVGMEYKFGGPVLNPLSRQMGFREQPGKDPLSDAQRIAAINRLKKDPAAPMIRLKDSLALAGPQSSQLSGLSKEYNARADTALRRLSDWVRGKGRRIFDADLSPYLSEARAGLAKLNSEYDKKVKAVLTADQLTLFGAMTGAQAAAPLREKP